MEGSSGIIIPWQALTPLEGGEKIVAKWRDFRQQFGWGLTGDGG